MGLTFVGRRDRSTGGGVVCSGVDMVAEGLVDSDFGIFGGHASPVWGKMRCTCTCIYAT